MYLNLPKEDRDSFQRPHWRQTYWKKNHTKNSFPQTISVLALMASLRAEVSAYSPTGKHTSHKALQTQVHSVVPSGSDGSQMELSISSDHHLQCLQCQASGFQSWQINGTGISLPPPSGNSTRPSKGSPPSPGSQHSSGNLPSTDPLCSLLASPGPTASLPLQSVLPAGSYRYPPHRPQRG